jgi:2-dehydro-3-deoxygluconokinase
VTPPAVITLGESMILLYPRNVDASLSETEELVVEVAGADSNFAIAMARLGFQTGWISRVGTDPLGERVLKTISREGVDTSQVMLDPDHPTGLYIKYHEAPSPLVGQGRSGGGGSRVLYYRRGSAASHLSPDDLNRDYFANIQVLQLSGMTCALSRACEETVRRAIELARERRARVCFDLNLRLQLWSLPAARQVIGSLLPAVSILFGSEEEYIQFFDKSSLLDALIEAHGLGPQTVVAHRGERGAVALVRGHMVSHPGYCPPKIVDVVGAGDGFNAGFVAAVLRDMGPEEALAIANQVGAAAVTTPGDFEGYPSWDDIGRGPAWPEREREAIDWPERNTG